VFRVAVTPGDVDDLEAKQCASVDGLGRLHQPLDGPAVTVRATAVPGGGTTSL
jgi:hypothetical protein